MFRYNKNRCGTWLLTFINPWPTVQDKSWVRVNLFEKNDTPYNLGPGDISLLPPAKSTSYGVNSLAFHGSLLWNNLPSQVKERQTLQEFKIGLRI